MTTQRYYFTSTAPTVSPPYSSVWDANNNVRGSLATSYTGTPFGATAAVGVRILGGQLTSAPASVSRVLSGAVSVVVRAARTNQTQDLYARVRLLVVSGDGATVRGVAFDQLGTTVLAWQNAVDQTITGTLTDTAFAAGDRLVLEIGAQAAATARRAEFQFNGDAYLDVNLVTIADPDPPTGLTLTGATDTTLDVSWTPPAAGGTPTGYEVRVAGGTPLAVGLTTSATLSGLDASTAYIVEARTIGPSSSVSAWSSPLTAWTAPAPPLLTYGAHLRVGTHTWDVSSNDEPGYGPLAGLRFTWAAPQDDGWPTQHTPTVLVFGVIVEAGTDFDDVDKGTPVHFTFTPEGQTTPLVEFGGTVRDLVGTPHPRGMLYSVTALDHLVALTEVHEVAAYFDGGDPLNDIWPTMLADGTGGIGITPPIGDPFAPGETPAPGGWLGVDPLAVQGNAWDALVGFLSAVTVSEGVPQRGILTYRLDPLTGDLDDERPYLGTWTTQTHDAPLPLSEGGWPDGGGNVDACLLRTDATAWQRQRIEPNKVQDTGWAGTVYVRAGRPTVPSPGDVVRQINYDAGWWEGARLTDGQWIVAGIDAPDQWSSEFALLGYLDPDVVAGWFTLPGAMMRAVGCHGIDPRHTPSGDGRMVGMLAGASLVIPAGGRWEVRFRLRRTLPD